jgi:hypothetical protein
MIQRIQSLFLLAAVISSFIVVFQPLAKMTMSDESIANFTSIGLRTDNDPSEMLFSAYPIAVIASITGIMSLITLILYRDRLLQMRLCGYNIILTLILIAVIFFYYFFMRKITFAYQLYIIIKSFSYPILLPFVNIILLFQSFRAIRRDDLLVKSYDRLR